MSQKKQTARKTTGKHVQFTTQILASRNAVKRARSAIRPKAASTSPAKSSLRSKALPKSILSRHSVAVPSPGSSTGLNVPLSAGGPLSDGAALTSGTVTRRRPTAGVALDTPISVYTQFAAWLENQACVHDDALLRAVERDGSHLLSLARATVMFDHALRGDSPPSVNGVADPLREHARTLRVFTELLESMISEGSLSAELEKAVLRDGEPLLQLALCCMDFDQAIRGSDSTG